MTVTIELQPEFGEDLRVLARENGLSPAAYLQQWIEKTLASRRNAAALRLLESWAAEDAVETPEEEAERRGEWEKLKTALDSSHSSDRALFP